LGKVGGIFHTDELPAYGISDEELSSLKKIVEATDEDAIVLVADEKQAVVAALNAVLDRAKMAIKGVPTETRAAQLDGTTRFSRPRPGAARMYPETDVPPVVIDSNRLQQVTNELPPSPEIKLMELIKKYNLNEKLASQILSIRISRPF